MTTTKKNLFKLLFFCFVLFSSNASYAESCDKLFYRVIAECSHAACENIFFIEDIPGASNGCFRRPKTSATPTWAKPIIEAEVSSNTEFQGKKVFELLILKNYWHGSEEPISYNAYLKFKSGAFSKNPQDVIRATFNAPQLIPIEDKSFSEVKTQWTESANNSAQKELILNVTNWATFILSMLALFISVKLFRQVQFKNKHKKYLYISFAIQLILFIIANLLLINEQTFLIAYHVLLIPFVWIYEVISLVLKRFRKTKTSNTPNNQ